MINEGNFGVYSGTVTPGQPWLSARPPLPARHRNVFGKGWGLPGPFEEGKRGSGTARKSLLTLCSSKLLQSPQSMGYRGSGIKENHSRLLKGNSPLSCVRGKTTVLRINRGMPQK